jgi:hypothetical protein
MRRLLKRFLPFTSYGGAALFAFRHRRPIWDWGTWAVRSAPRLVQGERDDVLAELRLRLKLAGDDRLQGDRLQVEVEDGRALISGEVERGDRKVVTSLAKDVPGVKRVSDALRERGRRRERVPA